MNSYNPAEPELDNGNANAARLAPEHHEASDEVLLPVMERLKAAEPDALIELFQLTAPTLFAMACHVLPDSAEADEVIADVYVEVSETAKQFDPSRYSVTTWLLTITRSKVIEHYRRNSSRRNVSPAFDSGSASKSHLFDYSADVDTVDSMHLNRTPLHRRLLSLAFFKGLSHSELATETGLALGTVKKHLRVALSTCAPPPEIDP